MSNTEKKNEKKPAPLNVVQRMDRIESVHDNLVVEVQQAFGRVDRKFTEQAELLAAIIDIVGQEAVVAKINERQAKRDAEAAEKAAAGVKLLVEQGTLKTVDVIGEETLIVGFDADADGEAVGPGRVQVSFRDLKPDFKEKLLGGKVGLKIVTAQDEEKGVTQTFEVRELYELVQAAPEATSTKDAEAATATASVTE